jgi:hypothetical protein
LIRAILVFLLRVDLSVALQNYSGVKNVDFETIWGLGHTQAEDVNGAATTNFVSWVEKCVADKSSGVNKVSTDPNAYEVARYSIMGVKLNAPVNGINIIKMSDGTVKKVLVRGLVNNRVSKVLIINIGTSLKLLDIKVLRFQR